MPSVLAFAVCFALLTGVFVLPEVLLHLLALYIVARTCLGELARDRPPVADLTGYFLWIALGGLLGAGFATLVAPLVFPHDWDFGEMTMLTLLEGGSVSDDVLLAGGMLPGALGMVVTLVGMGPVLVSEAEGRPAE